MANEDQGLNPLQERLSRVFILCLKATLRVGKGEADHLGRQSVLQLCSAQSQCKWNKSKELSGYKNGFE